jgi:GntR family transcriptional regulator
MDDLNALFSIATGSAEPIYRQLVEQLRRRVAAGQWRPGDEVPSVRELAQALAVNPMTVSKAFSLLEAQGVLERRRGLSMVVAAQPGVGSRAADRGELLRPTLARAAAEAHELGLSDARALALFKSALQNHPNRETE